MGKLVVVFTTFIFWVFKHHYWQRCMNISNNHLETANAFYQYWAFSAAAESRNWTLTEEQQEVYRRELLIARHWGNKAYEVDHLTFKKCFDFMNRPMLVQDVWPNL